MDTPEELDRSLAKNPRAVYQVEVAVPFMNPVILADVGIRNYQFGKYISLEQFNRIKETGKRGKPVKR